MKRRIILLSTICFAVAVFAQSCGKAVNCINLAAAVSTAGANYASDQSTANCQAYKTALQDWLAEEDCYSTDQTTKDTYQAVLNSLTC